MSDAYDGLLAASERANARAVGSGKVKVDGEVYAYQFNPTIPGYRFTDATGEHVVTLIGKSIRVVLRNFREYMA